MGEVVHVVWGRHSKFEVVKTPRRGIFEPTYSIHRDGKYWRGSFDSLAKAVEAAEADAKR